MENHGKNIEKNHVILSICVVKVVEEWFIMRCSIIFISHNKYLKRIDLLASSATMHKSSLITNKTPPNSKQQITKTHS